MLACAGAAERRAGFPHGRCSDNDYRDISRYTKGKVPPEQVTSEWQLALDRADALVTRQWDFISACAEALLAKGELRMAEIDQLWSRHGKPKPTFAPLPPPDNVRVRFATDLLHREAPIGRANSYDPDTRVAEAVISTGAAVLRTDNWSGEQWRETLDMGGVRLGRLNNGAQVLDGHSYAGGYASVMGSVVPGSARVIQNKLLARLRFSRNEAGERVARNLIDGHCRPDTRRTRKRSIAIPIRKLGWRRTGSLTKYLSSQSRPRRRRAFGRPRRVGAVLRAVTRHHMAATRMACRTITNPAQDLVSDDYAARRD